MEGFSILMEPVNGVSQEEDFGGQYAIGRVSGKFSVRFGDFLNPDYNDTDKMGHLWIKGQKPKIADFA